MNKYEKYDDRPLSFTSRSDACSCCDTVVGDVDWTADDGVDFKGVLIFLTGVDGKLPFTTSVCFASSVLTCVSASRISLTLLHLVCKSESGVKPAKFILKLRRVLLSCGRPAGFEAAFGRVFGVVESSRDWWWTAFDKFKSLQGESGKRFKRTEGEVGSGMFFVLFDGDEMSSCAFSLLFWFSSEIFKLDTKIFKLNTQIFKLNTQKELKNECKFLPLIRNSPKKKSKLLKLNTKTRSGNQWIKHTKVIIRKNQG